MKTENPFATGTGGSPYRLQPIPETGRMSPSAAADNADVLYRNLSDLHGNVRSIRRQTFLQDLESRRTAHDKKSPVDMLAELSDLGFAWRDIARILDVSVAAVTKWRRGDGVTGENRLKLAKLLAVIDMLQERLVNDPASWLEMRIRDQVALTRIDILAARREDLVLDLASAHTGDNTIEAVLDKFDPQWRTSRVDDAFETFLADDGIVSIRPKSS